MPTQPVSLFGQAPAPLLQPDPAAQRRIQLGQALQAQGLQTSPVQHPVQALARLAQAVAGAHITRSAEEAERARGRNLQTTLGDALMAGRTGVKEFRDPDNPQNVLLPGAPPGLGAIAQTLGQNPDTAATGFNLQLGSLLQGQEAANNRVRTLTAQEVQAAGFPPGTVAQMDASGAIKVLDSPPEILQPGVEDARGRVARAGRNQTTVTVGKEETEFEKALGQQRAKSFNTIQDQADEAIRQSRELETIGALLDQADTGRFVKTTTEIKALAKRIGIDLAALGIRDDVAPIEAAEALSNSMALRMRNPESGFGLTGNTSDRDLTFLQSLTARASQTPAGRRLMIEVFRRLNRRKQEEAAIAQDVVAEFKTFRQDVFRERANRLAQEQPLFDDLGDRLAAAQDTAPTTPIAPAPLGPETFFDSVDAVPEGAEVVDDETGERFVKRKGVLVPLGPK